MGGGLRLFKDTEINFQHKTFEPFGKTNKKMGGGGGWQK